jgi:hypothetical protein
MRRVAQEGHAARLAREGNQEIIAASVAVDSKEATSDPAGQGCAELALHDASRANAPVPEVRVQVARRARAISLRPHKDADVLALTGELKARQAARWAAWAVMGGARGGRAAARGSTASLARPARPRARSSVRSS